MPRISCRFITWVDVIKLTIRVNCRSQWPRGLRRRSAAARLPRSWVRIPPGAWMFVCCECCVLSGRGLCDELITRPEESYWLWCVVVCDLETTRMRRPWPALGRSATQKKSVNCNSISLSLHTKCAISFNNIRLSLLWDWANGILLLVSIVMSCFCNPAAIHCWRAGIASEVCRYFE